MNIKFWLISSGELIHELNEIKNNNDDKVVYLKNLEDDEYYAIENIRIDDENDIVLDIKYSTV